MQKNMALHTARPKRRIGTLIWLIVSQLMAVGSLLIWALLAGLSGMAADEGTSPQVVTFILVIWAYPIFPLIMAIGAWIAFACRKNWLAAILSGMTIAPPVLLALFVWIANLIGPSSG
jgi:hypothetical protein